MPVNNLLFELGTEELPPKSLNRLRLSLADNCRKGLAEAQLAFDEIDSFATPRRLALVITGLADCQPDQRVERRGPAVKAAFDAQGTPTKALDGFMRSVGVTDPAELDRLETDKGQWLVYRAEQKGAPLPELLESILDRALADLPIDRRMRWGKSRAEFVRPVLWAVCLYGKDILPINILGRQAGRNSEGHRFMGSGAFEITHADNYLEALRQHFVIGDFDERKALILTQVESLASDANASLEMDDSLLEEVTALVEWPVALMGGFEERFLEVPQEVLISAMKEHQRYFHLVENSTGKLKPAFITVSNIESSDPGIIVTGNERVIRPRLSDASFFFQQDTRIPLADRVENLGNVVFQTELGTYQQKAKRISALASAICRELGGDSPAAERAGLLCKADLVSDMVGEFPDLQGVMGGYYARHDNESDETAKGIEQHYRPLQAGGRLPEGAVASSVALADKLDTIVGLFGIDQPPTGSRDPFALRRQSLGVIRICIENQLNLDLSWCLARAAQGYGRDFSVDSTEAYIIERLTGYYSDQGISGDIVDAAVHADRDSCFLFQIDSVIRALKSFRESSVAEQVIAANKRIANILKKADGNLNADFDHSLATDDAEAQLATAVDEFTLDSHADAAVRLEKLATLQAPVDRFFDEVLVMSEDPEIRNNRLILLNRLRSLFLKAADFSLLQ